MLHGGGHGDGTLRGRLRAHQGMLRIRVRIRVGSASAETVRGCGISVGG